MKTLQDCLETTHDLSGAFPLKTVDFIPEQPRSLILLLHGYNERGLRIFRKLRRSLPEDAHIIAPNGIFPLPRLKTDRLDFGYAWYFYDKFTGSYEIDQALAAGMLKQLLASVNPRHLPVTIIGFSQGGYLAPFLAYAEPDVKHVIGIGCEFRTRFFTRPPTFSLAAIHGEADHLVSFEHAKQEVTLLKKQGIEVDWHPVSELKHEITRDVGLIVTQLLEQYGKAGL